jgi:hypothetical protein
MGRCIDREPDMNDREFYTAVSASDFSDRYYALCRQFPVRDISPCLLSNDTISTVLSALGRTTHRDARDNSYGYDQVYKHGKLHVGFIIQKQTMLEYWFWVDQNDQRTGSNYAVIAYEAAKLAGKATPQPPYPRPEFHSVDELQLILAELFDLADELLAILERNM